MSDGEFRQILVAVDFSEVSARALRVAVRLARKLGANLKVVHAVPLQAASMPMEGGAVYIEDLHARQVEEARGRLAEFVEEHGGSGIASDYCVRPGDPASEISRAAEELGADLIVVGTHGRTGLSHLLMGSVAENVLQEAAVPVLCVRG